MSNAAATPSDAFFARAKSWREEQAALRALALACGLEETLKWGKPCYTTPDGANIVLIQTFKGFCALLFFKGALIEDPKGMLVAPGENSQSARQARFTSVAEIDKAASTLKAYIRKALTIEKAGLKVELKTITEHAVPEELQACFAKAPAFKAAFEALTPGRQRAYLLHFSGAKQSATRASRIEKCRPQILAGKGLND
jgi:uncharacterized protein YdeI (YjbR/CyaY-like superfamily)